jgi:hypothetical protein
MVDIFKLMTLKANDGQTIISKHNKETWLYPLRFLDESTLALYRQGFMTSGSETLAVNESRSFYIPLIGDIFCLNELILSSIKGEVSYEFSFDSSVWGDGGVPDLTKLSLITRHQAFDIDAVRLLKNRYNSSRQEFLYREMVEMNFKQTLSPSSEINLILNQFNSPASELYVQISSAGQMISEFEQHIDTYDVTDEDDNSIIGSKPVSVDYHKYVLNAAHDITSVLESNVADPWLVIPFSSDSHSDYLEGSINGFHKFTSKDQLKLVTRSDLTAGSYNIRVYYAKIRRLIITGGKISLSD